MPRIIGPYRIDGVLGRGGMGVVYRGEHVDTGEAAAVKTVSVASTERLASIRREIHTLGRIGHPGVVRILAQGVSQGLPWYAMELLSGETLRDRIERLWGRRDRHAHPSLEQLLSARLGGRTERLPCDGGMEPAAVAAMRHTAIRDQLVPVLEIMYRLCTTLAFVHGNGLVHRDLKPENIFIRDDGQPILVDLGISADFGSAESREQLAAEGCQIGSCPYIAPEQVRGELVDARADLYSIGCILYECLVGRPPFVGTPSEILAAHLSEEPVAPVAIWPDIPPALGELVLRLLQKRPRDRIGYAEDLAARLRAFDTALDREPRDPAVVRLRARPYLYRPDMAGRTHIVTDMQNALERLVGNGTGDFVLLAGESGVGKTRLAMEIARLANLRGCTVVTGQCATLSAGEASQRAQAGGAALQPLKPLLLTMADHCRAHGVAATEAIFGPRGALLQAYEPGLADLAYAEMHPEPAPLPVASARARLFAYLEQTLLAFADNNPLVLVVDDLQWADELSLDFLRTLVAGQLRGHPVLIIGTCRIEDMPDLGDTWRDSGVILRELARLDAASIQQMVCDMLALDRPPADLLEFLIHTSGGNPFFIAEYLREAVAEGLLARDRAGTWRFTRPDALPSLDRALPLPESLHGLIQGRLSRLDQTSRWLVESASALGRAFDLDILAATVRVPDHESVMDAIMILRRHQIIEDSAGGQLRFVHDKLRELAYAGIHPGARAGIHRRAAEAIEIGYPEGRADREQTLAHHWSVAGVPERASRYFSRAGDRAQASYASGEAATLYRAAIAEMLAMLPEEMEPRDASDAWKASFIDVHEKLGDVLTNAGQQADCRMAYQRALDHLAEDARIQRGRVLYKLGKAWEIHHQHERALAVYESAEAALGEPPAGDAQWWHEWVELQDRVFYVHYWQGHVDGMSAVVDKVRPVVEERGTTLQRLRFYHHLLALELRRERFGWLSEQGVENAYRALVLARETGSMTTMAFSRFMYGFGLYFRGAFDRAEQELETALREAERIGDITLQSRCVTYLMLAQRNQGKVDDVEQRARRALAVARAGQMADYIATATANLGWVAWRHGHLAEAEQLGRAACDTWNRLQHRYPYPIQWMARLHLLALEVDGGVEAQPIGRAAEQARILLDPSQQRLPARLAEYLEQGVNDWDAGRQAEAHAHFAQAVTAARETGYL